MAFARSACVRECAESARAERACDRHAARDAALECLCVALESLTSVFDSPGGVYLPDSSEYFIFFTEMYWERLAPCDSTV